MTPEPLRKPPTDRQAPTSALARWRSQRRLRRAGWPEQRRQRTEAIEGYLLSKRAAGFWLGLSGAFIGTAAGLRAAGVSTGWTLVLAGLFFAGFFRLGLRAWVEPERFGLRRLAGLGGLMMLATYAATVAVAARQMRLQWGRDLGWGDLPQLLWLATPLQLMMGLLLLLLVWGIASAGRVQLQDDLARLQLVQERDAAARQAAEARLRLLQVQIQPHFIFNTLAALQHWVDNGDPRAPGLLRALTGFLRASTELMDRDETTLGEELAMLRHYLQIQQARLGERLQWTLALPPGLSSQVLAPGLLLTLVENAIEHGVAPALAGGHITLQVQPDGAGLRVEVDNSGVPLGQPRPADGLGLGNSRERLLRQAGPSARLWLETLPDGRTRAGLWLPRREAAR